MSSMENKCNLLQWKTLPNTHERNARACAVNVMSFCMQPDAQSVHICESKTGGVKTPKHRVLDCLDFSVMRYDDRLSLWGLQDISYRRMGVLILDCYYSSPAPLQPPPPRSGKILLSFLYLFCRATWWYLPSNRQRDGKAERLDLTIY